VNFKGRALIALAGCTLVILLQGCAHRVLVQPVLDMSQYNRIAVLPFETDSYLSTVGNQMSDEIVVQLLTHAPTIDVVERTRIDALLREQNLSRDHLVTAESAVAVGRLLGVKIIMTGSLSVAIGDIRPAPGNSQRVATGTATARLIDTESGKIIWGGREESNYSTFLGEGGYSAHTDQEMIEYVIRDLGKQLSEVFYPHYELEF
jgi:TolB-like protein